MSENICFPAKVTHGHIYDLIEDPLETHNLAEAHPELFDELFPHLKAWWNSDFGFAEALATLEPFLPPEVWARRAELFHEGMRLEVGPCFRRYAPPADMPGPSLSRLRLMVRVLRFGPLRPIAKVDFV